MPPRVSATGGGVSRLRRLLIGGAGGRDGDPALLADPRRFPGEPAQEVQLGAPYPALPQQADFGDQRRVQREDPLDAHTRGNLADGERLVDAAAAPRDANALEQIGRASCREKCRSRWSPYH